MKKIVFILIIICFITACKEEIKEENIIGKKLDKPMIKEAMTGDSDITIVSNLYCYGDVNFDNEINELDLEIYDYLLTDNFIVDDNQFMLADLDKDNKITSNDKKLLEEYLKENKSYKYDNTDLEYCISKENNIESCEWQKDNVISLVNEDYYIFSRNSVNDEISNFYHYNYIAKEVASFIDDDR